MDRKWQGDWFREVLGPKRNTIAEGTSHGDNNIEGGADLFGVSDCRSSGTIFETVHEHINSYEEFVVDLGGRFSREK